MMGRTKSRSITTKSSKQNTSLSLELACTIRPASAPFHVGDRVFVNWKNYGHYYAGRLAKEHPDGTFLVHFEDGDVEDNVEWGRIEPLDESSQTVQDYIVHDTEAENELIEAFEVFDTNKTGTISAKEYLRILTEIGDDPISTSDVLQEFAELGIAMDSEIDYKALAKFMVASENSGSATPVKPEVVIRDAHVEGPFYEALPTIIPNSVKGLFVLQRFVRLPMMNELSPEWRRRTPSMLLVRRDGLFDLPIIHSITPIPLVKKSRWNGMIHGGTGKSTTSKVTNITLRTLGFLPVGMSGSALQDFKNNESCQPSIPRLS